MATIINETKKQLPEVRALRTARELKLVSRKDLAVRLEVTIKAIEKLENGRMNYSKEHVSKVLNALGVSQHDFRRIKRGKKLGRPERPKLVTKNQDRRSYKKNITKECRVLRILREQMKISQDTASNLCGYSRPTIGHIENGRIELTLERIMEIIKAYGHSMKDFNEQMNAPKLKDKLLKDCIKILESVPNEKLQNIHLLLCGINNM